MKSLLVVALLLASQVAQARESWDTGQGWETPIPQIRTEAELRKYRTAKKVFCTTAVIAGVGAIFLAKYAGDLHRKAGRIDIVDGVVGYPVANGGVQYRQVVNQGRADRKSRLYARASGAKKGALGAALLSILMASATVSVSF